VFYSVEKCKDNNKWLFKSALSGSGHDYTKGTSQKWFGGTEDNIPIWTASSQWLKELLNGSQSVTT
jgi:hypothetical protein